MSVRKSVLAVLMATAITTAVPVSMNCMLVTTSADASICDLYNKSCSSDISISGSTATCHSKVIGISGKTTKICINQVLEKKNSSGSWIYCKSSSKTENGVYSSLTKSYSALAKGTYRVKTTAYVYAGNKSETVTRYSSTQTVR